MPPAVRIRPYKDFLTPALHRRFALATAVLAAVCYVEAVWIGEWNSCRSSSASQISMHHANQVLQSFGHGFLWVELVSEPASSSPAHL